ncbi:homocysteine S-methyltransferase protein [Marine Group I thaumarchaeote SCGC RSA3]|uniref:Homocysteine S-methyltransferase protein n=4 Tax=Marine Group I TaxID=905826 RepID=A0A081RMS2_9ARCH|nr:homocysteine S-methyltransferase protein [Marine Group I thaumarchaeote SCGC AAA799-N04]KFM15634.1 homocysteine S-methyltransferase protein [Marine Group I thaumarchaeote SCGC AAA799-D11]KFM16749.1 homocysteine S-methyltransferase protein [Marine Group I thaumarchaeote SCGC RSA3]
MTIRYEANPPKILPDVDTDQSIKKFIERIKNISKKCDAIHLTENVLGFQRVSPLEVGKIIKEEIPDLPITVSLRVRDKSEEEIFEFAEKCVEIGFAGILVLMGDPSQTGKADSGQIPSLTVKKLREKNVDSKINLYLSVSNKPNFAKLAKKKDARPKGFMTQVVQNTEQVQALSDNLKEFSIIPIILFPSQKNEKSAKFLGLDLESYSKEFEELLRKSHEITGDVLLTSPNDFTGLNEFLGKTTF